MKKVQQSTVNDVERMINEGLGAGFIIYQYDIKKFEPAKRYPVEKMEEEKDESTN